MPPALRHESIAADAYRLPASFGAFAVRSEEPVHAGQARSPYGRVHRVRTAFLGDAARERLAAAGHARVRLAAFSDIDYAPTTLDALAALAAEAGRPPPDLLGALASALRATGVLGDDPDAYRRCVLTRIDFLGACGAGFHNDVARHWSRCLFWVLALDAQDVEFVMPHAGVRVALAPGDLLVFDPALAHGLCRPADAGQAVAESFEAGAHRRQLFLTGEIALSDAQWAALGAPWLPLQAHAGRQPLDLLVAEFDERSGAIQRLRELRQAMSRGILRDDPDTPPSERPLP